MRGLGIAVACASVLLSGCRSSVQPVTRDYFEGDHVSNYRRIFELSPPEDVDVVNSLVIAYGAAPGVMTRDDWAFELVVPAEWIDKTARLMHLARAEEVTAAVDAINYRKEHPLRPWYAPSPITEYELYYLTLTSHPHIQMLVDAQPEPDGRRKVFISKH